MDKAHLDAIGDYERALMCLMAYGATSDDNQRRQVLEKFYDAALRIEELKIQPTNEKYYDAVMRAEAAAKAILMQKSNRPELPPEPGKSSVD